MIIAGIHDLRPFVPSVTDPDIIEKSSKLLLMVSEL